MTTQMEQPGDGLESNADADSTDRASCPTDPGGYEEERVFQIPTAQNAGPTHRVFVDVCVWEHHGRRRLCIRCRRRRGWFVRSHLEKEILAPPARLA